MHRLAKPASHSARFVQCRRRFAAYDLDIRFMESRQVRKNLVQQCHSSLAAAS
jgi:hypothetical protein